MTKRFDLNLKLPLCTDNPTGSDIYPFGDVEKAQHVANTGIERQGGVTNLYEQETTFATAGLQSLVTKSGDLLQVDSSHNIRINDTAIGNVGSYAVSGRGALKDYSDAAWTATNTIIGIVKIGQTIRVDEINPTTGAILNTRATTFTMPSVAITNVVLVKYVGMAFADSLTFILSNNLIAYSLVEANAPTISIIGGQTWTSRTSANARVWLSVCWSPQLSLFCAVAFDGAVATQVMTSPDGLAWTARTSASARQWWSICWSPQLGLFCAVAVDGLVATQIMTSPDGIIWTSRTSASAQQWRSICWSPQLGLFCAVAATGAAATQVMTSSDGINWASHTSASAQQWYSVTWAAELNLFCAVAQDGAVGVQVMTSPDGVSWSSQTSASAQQWSSVCWSPQLGLFCAVAVNGVAAVQVMTSPDGSAWTSRTSANSQTWTSVAWSPELNLFCAVGQDDSPGINIMISSDGIIWTSQTSPSARDWRSVAWSPQLNIFCAVAIEGAVGVQVMTSSQVAYKTNLAWKFAANKFLVGSQGVGVFSIGDIAATMTAITDATWCVIDTFAGTAFSRAILTFPVKKQTTNLLSGIGEVGHNQAGTYSATPTYYGVALAAVTVTIGSHAEGPGYSEATFTRSDTGTNIYYYLAPIMQHIPGQWYDVSQSQTQTLCNGYGRLSDFNGNTLGNTCSLRVMMELGIPTTITAGVIGAEASYDNLGVPITNVGEFDEFYMPHVTDDGSTRLNCIYRYNGILFFFTIQSGVTNTLQAVSDNVYMVNCLSPINAIDVANRTLSLGSNDYNGRILFRSTAAIIATVKCVGIMQAPYSNSSDTGDKLITQTFSTTTNIVPGIELPTFVDRAVVSYGVNIYLADTYSITYQSFNVTYTNPSQVGVLYVPDTRIPFGMGYTFGVHTMQTEIETIFTGVGVTGSANINYDYLGYEIGNDTPGLFESFQLFGQQYLFDGTSIWLAIFDGSLLSGKGNSPVAPATGMQLIASAPVEIYFLSAFDNSLYVFNGGRALTKMHRFNDIRNASDAIETITDGVYSVADNTLLMQTASTFIWIRDTVITQNAKKANQTAISLFDSVNGIQIANTTTKWRYTFTDIGSTTVVPLVFQSAYFGDLQEMATKSLAFDVTLWSPSKAQTDIILSCFSFDADVYSTQTRPIRIAPSDWTALGLFRCRIQPETELAVGASVGVSCAQKVVITGVTMEYGDSVPSVVRTSRSV